MRTEKSSNICDNEKSFKFFHCRKRRLVANRKTAVNTRVLKKLEVKIRRAISSSNLLQSGQFNKRVFHRKKAKAELRKQAAFPPDFLEGLSPYLASDESGINFGSFVGFSASANAWSSFFSCAESLLGT